MDFVDAPVLVGDPEGRAVYVNVTLLTDEGWVRDRAATWEPAGRAGPTSGPPDRARVASRPIPVRTRGGVVVTGRLHVAVWDPTP